MVCGRVSAFSGFVMRMWKFLLLHRADLYSTLSIYIRKGVKYYVYKGARSLVWLERPAHNKESMGITS